MCHIVSPKWRPNAEIAWHHDRYPRALVHKTRESDFGKNDTISMRLLRRTQQQHQGYFSNFPKISEHFPKISKIFQNSPNSVRSSYEHFRSFSENVRSGPKISEDCRRLPNVSEQSSKMFRSHRNEYSSFDN